MKTFREYLAEAKIEKEVKINESNSIIQLFIGLSSEFKKEVNKEINNMDKYELKSIYIVLFSL